LWSVHRAGDVVDCELVVLADSSGGAVTVDVDVPGSEGGGTLVLESDDVGAVIVAAVEVEETNGGAF
jgi:hypothetical protein